MLLATTVPASAAADDVTVYTTVTRVGKDAADSPVVGRSLTLFHAGKVYDWMEDFDEVVIFEPIHDRFVIMNGDTYIAARVEFSELHQFLNVARHEAEKYLQELSVSDDRADRRRAAALEFQLQPKFEERYEPTLNRLQLAGDTLSYNVETARIEDAQVIRQYLVYADWACRLNYVLHPHSMYPASRVALNASLMEKGLLPTSVELRTQIDEEEVVLRASHKFQWELQPSDKTHINFWERLLDSDKIEWVSFHEYQQQLFSESVARD
ncbi:MAG: hypothetical protein DWQ34_11665 [Planctomycetota bacterium]|nr:MAG: hypothetical protein DWQ29_07060 [Planctomycetota bacterium]REJ93119.1 MAG: hypothetical protein DWQ34_11665 [Planctomycetota bacterium]REK30108.1 MAG: hypothetical protein DWQ41_02970 [Planctomycetota bacterium]REK37650.1 MAG: hypothetical protein DWQ45_06555 [Planctomycetota bacterium]